MVSIRSSDDLSQGSLACPTCAHGRIFRALRVGLLDETIYAWLGLYPWLCALCGVRVHLKMQRFSRL